MICRSEGAAAPVRGYSAVPVSGCNAVPLSGCPGAPVRGCTDAPVSGCNGLPLSGCTGAPVSSCHAADPWWYLSVLIRPGLMTRCNHLVDGGVSHLAGVRRQRMR